MDKGGPFFMQPPLLTPSAYPKRLPLISLVTGAIGLMLVLLLMLYILYALSHEYFQPGDLIIHFGWLLFPLAFVVGIVSLVLGIVATRRRDRPQTAATVGIVLGVMTCLAVSVITRLFIHF